RSTPAPSPRWWRSGPWSAERRGGTGGYAPRERMNTCRNTLTPEYIRRARRRQHGSPHGRPAPPAADMLRGGGSDEDRAGWGGGGGAAGDGALAGGSGARAEGAGAA